MIYEDKALLAVKVKGRNSVMERIKLLAVDMDGTALRNDHITISERNLKTIQKAIDLGIIFVPATGRMKNHYPEALFQLSGWKYGITSNGAAVYDFESDALIESAFIETELMIQLLDLLDHYHLFYEVYCNGSSFIDNWKLNCLEEFGVTELEKQFLKGKCRGVDDIREFLKQPDSHAEKIYIPYLTPLVHTKVYNRLLEFPVAITSSVDTNLEVNSLEANKGNALKKLCRTLGILPQQVMAIGDNNNDIEMLKFAGISVAMKNGDEKTKECADYITDTNEQDGVSAAIEKFLL